MDPRDFRSLLRQTVVVPVLLVAILAGVLLWQISYLNRAYTRAQETESIESSARLFMRMALDMETGARGYLITGDRRFLEPYEKSEPQIEQTLAELTSRLHGDARKEATVAQLRSEFGDWKQWNDSVMAAGPRSPQVTNIENNLRGKQLMDRVRDTREQLLNELQAETKRRNDLLRRDMRRFLLLLIAASAIVALLLAFLIRHGTASLIQTYVRHLDAERRNAAEASEAREWLMTTLRSMREAVFTADHHGKITFMNPTAEALTGLGIDEALSQPLKDVLSLVDEFSREPVSPLGEAISSSGDSKNGTALLRRPDAQILYVEYSSAPIGTGAELAGNVVIVRDISERRRSEAALRSSERLSLLGRLSATIAHEIRNPLDAVMNLIYLIRTASNLDDTAKGFAVTAEEELQRIAQITHQLLAFNREAKQPVETDIGELIAGVVKLFGPKLSAASIEVKQQIEPSKPVIALPGELRQVFSNLIANAIDVLPSGGTLTIRVSDAREHGMRLREGVRVTIADNGPGIPEAVMHSLFTPFFTTKGEKGTGLGLWVSRGIITKHEGRLQLRSSTAGVHRGTVFSIFLPRHPESSALRTPAA